jgi:hypothetical protein
MASLLWLPIALLVPASLVLVRLKMRAIGPVAAWSWWLVTAPFWLPVALLVGFAIAWLLLGLFLLASGIAPL